jgi:REP element-mobilizing transposase RayT
VARRSYSEIFLHLVWHTKESRPLLVPTWEGAAHRALRNRTDRHPGTILYAINGTDNHVHLAVRVPPTLLISDFIGDLKGSSSHALNQEFAPQERFAWQGGYGVVSFGAAHLDWVIDYIQHQKEHHDTGKIQSRLEQTEDDTEDAPEAQ